MTPTYLRNLWLEMRREKQQEILSNWQKVGDKKSQKKKDALAELHLGMTGFLDTFKAQG